MRAVIGCAAVIGALTLAVAATAAQQASVLDGVFTAAQAERGADIYAAHCAGCHDGADVDGPPLTGSPFVDRWREDTLDALFDFMKTRMPQSKPGSLSEAQYIDILAHLLQENAYPAGFRELSQAALARTLLVGPRGPQPLPNGALIQVVGCLVRTAAGEQVIERGSQPIRARVGDEITAAEAAASNGAALESQNFTLQNVGEDGIALPASGHKVLIKGALTQRAGGARIHVTAARSVADSCD
jgi:S-disulfanyl-L-cysteine oxidoreductase SoxD